MNQATNILVVLAILPVISACSVINGQQPAGANRSTALAGYHSSDFDSAAQCKQALRQTTTGSAAELDSAEIEVLVWNIKKGESSNWREDLDALASNKDLLLLQEASLSMQPADLLSPSAFWAFAPGYATRDTITGVVNLSQIQPLSHCQLAAYEPWFGTPKATSVTRYALSNSNTTLLVVNTHMINFSLGLKEFRAQLVAVIEVIAEHNGPVIFSGDFNTWRPARYRVLEDLMSDLYLVAIEFEEDHRVRFFGSAVDHVFIRGLRVEAASTHRLESSDHNPMSIRLSLQP